MWQEQDSGGFGIIRVYPTAILVNCYWKIKLNIILIYTTDVKSLICSTQNMEFTKN
jgi:hypothetical protein